MRADKSSFDQLRLSLADSANDTLDLFFDPANFTTSLTLARDLLATPMSSDSPPSILRCLDLLLTHFFTPSNENSIEAFHDQWFDLDPPVRTDFRRLLVTSVPTNNNIPHFKILGRLISLDRTEFPSIVHFLSPNSFPLFFMRLCRDCISFLPSVLSPLRPQIFDLFQRPAWRTACLEFWRQFADFELRWPDRLDSPFLMADEAVVTAVCTALTEPAHERAAISAARALAPLKPPGILAADFDVAIGGWHLPEVFFRVAESSDDQSLTARAIWALGRVVRISNASCVLPLQAPVWDVVPRGDLSWQLVDGLLRVFVALVHHGVFESFALAHPYSIAITFATEEKSPAFGGACDFFTALTRAIALSAEERIMVANAIIPIAGRISVGHPVGDRFGPLLGAGLLLEGFELPGVIGHSDAERIRMLVAVAEVRATAEVKAQAQVDAVAAALAADWLLLPLCNARLAPETDFSPNELAELLATAWQCAPQKREIVARATFCMFLWLKNGRDAGLVMEGRYAKVWDSAARTILNGILRKIQQMGMMI
jgi:hypothetical protein